MEENNVKTSAGNGGSKKLFIISIVISVICAASLITSVLIAVLFPRADKIEEIDGTRFTSAFNLLSEDWFYTTDRTVARLNERNEVIETLDLSEYAKDNGIDMGKVISTYTNSENGEDYIYIAAIKSGDDNNGYIFRLRNDGEKLSVEEHMSYAGQYRKMLEKNGNFFLFSQTDSFISISKYDAKHLSDENGKGVVTGKGAIYQAYESYNSKEKRNEIILEKATLTQIFSADIVDDTMFIVHDGGIITCSVDFVNNGYKAAFESLRDQLYAERIAEDPTIKKNSLDEEAAKEFISEAGLVNYEPSTGKVTLAANNFDTSKYGYFVGDKFCGSAYVKEHDRFYILSKDEKLFYVDRGDLLYGELGSYFELNEVKGIELYAQPSQESPALLYNEYTHRGYVIYNAEAHMSGLLFDSEEKSVSLEFTVESEFDLNRVVQNGDNIYYFYYNRFETKEAGKPILSVIDIKDLQKVPLMRVLLIVFIVITVLSGIICFILWRAYKNRKFKDKTVSLLKSVARSKWVYIAMIPSIILLISFCYYPAVASIRLSFFEYSVARPTMRWNNFQNYVEVFTNSYTKEMFFNLALFLVYDIFIALIPPVIFAFFLTVMRNRGYSTFIRIMLFVPGVIPGMAGLLLWREGIFNNNGGVLHLLLGLFTDNPHKFLVSSATTRYELLIMGFPFIGSYLIFYGGMMSISDSFYEAAELEGITIWKRLLYIDIPLIMPQMKYIFIMTFIHSVQNFMRVDAMTDGLKGTMIPIKMIYDKINKSGEYGEASAYATLMFIFLLFATATSLRRRRDEVEI